MKFRHIIFRRILFISLILAFVSSSNLFAKSKPVVEKKVENKESWKETVELNELKKGKYNVFVTAEDQSGNTSVEGPHNIYVDPDSDLPIADISNPHPNMHVPGNLNIVGTCVDDDKVKAVQILIDPTGNIDVDVEHVITVSGTDYWSYFLDTSNMEEGEHSIEVWGIDENDLAGNHKTVKWHLDRKQPKVTIDESHQMGERVSGTIKLSGTVTDGNGISRLMYSLNRDENYSDIKFKSNKDATKCEFSLSIDTKKLSDGGQICWFKTSDKQGSVGYASFLFFVDNTKPEINVVYPPVGEAVNGIFTAAGYAKDAMGIQSLSWEFGGKSGDFELTAGNPYWALELDSRSISGKSSPLVITAVDGVGNVSTVKYNIALDQASDKAQVVIESPVENSIVGSVEKNDLFLRGIASDDDGVVKINFVLDSYPIVEVATDGVFCVDILASLKAQGIENPLSVGNHTVKVWATDCDEVQGTEKVVKFSVSGALAEFSNRIINEGKGRADKEYVAGTQLNVQNSPVYKAEVSSENGIKSVVYNFDGKDEVVLTSNLNKPKFSYQIPIKDCPYGFCKLTVKATDIFDQVVEDVVYFYVADLTTTRSEELYKPQVIFTDNKVDETGVIDVSVAGSIVSGYFVGAKASQVRFEPSTNFATIKLDGNSIILTKGSAQGLSDPVSIVVKSHRGIEYKTKPFVLKAATPEPKINFVGLASIVSASGTTTTAGAIGAGASATAGVVPIVLDGFSDIAINGNVSCFTSSNSRNNATVQSVKYRIRTNPGKAWSEWQTISEENANFSLNLSSDSLPLGISVVEFLAQDSLGQTGSNAVFVKKVSPLAEGEKLTSPQVLWIEGENFYFTANYRGTLEGESFQMVYRSSLNFGTTNLSASVTDEAGKNYSSSCVAKRQSTISSFIDKIGEKKYVSGMEIPLASSMASSSSGEQSALVSVVVECPVALSSIKYNFANQGEKTISAKSILPSGENRYEIQFPISSTEYKTHDLIVTALSADGTSQTIKGTVSIVQADFPQELKKIQEKTYWALPSSGTIKTGESIFGYANVVAPIRATISNGGQGLSVKTEGNNIILTAEKSGIYSNVVVSVVDAEGISYNSEALNFSSDSICPTVKINAPLNMAWVQNKIELSGVASDDFGVAKIEWSIDGKQTWNAFSSTSSFSQSIDISSFEDGLIGLDVRATDRAGNEGFAHVCAQKRTTPPQIDVLVPCENDIVNGMTLLVFKVQDSLSILRALYGGDTNKALKVSHYMPVMVGTNEYPISNEMSFVFTDKAGNSTVLKDWKFKVDKAGDLTRAEIHIPSEGEAITDDFVVSGVVMDDDGDCHIFYKIDNGNYIALEGWKNSFSIPLSIKDFSDNEHTISVYGTDIHGVSGNVAVRMFKVSLEEPKGAIVNPSFDKTVKDKVRISGWASDKNGIKKVQVSTDNGNTWNDAVGGAEWYYDFDTRVINDGTHTIFIKIFDNCGIQAIYSNLINIDNQKPEIRMELPLDGSIVSKNLFISGYIADNIKITKLGLNITSLDPKISVPQSLARINMESEGIVTKVVDVSSLSNGVYNVELVGEDAAGNMTRVSRNIEINKKADASHVDILTPFTGSHISGEFDISGMAESEFSYEKLELYIDGKLVSETELSPTGYFKFAVPGTQQEKSKNAKKTDKKSADGKIDSDGKTSGGETSDVAVADENGTETEVQVPRLADGLHKIQVRGKVTGGSVILSPEVTVDYKYAGPWIKIDNFSLGDFAMNRPKITGTAGYNLTEEESAIAKKGFKLISSERKYDIMTKSLEKVEVSWDNGQSFETLGKKKNWNFRVENEYLKDGFHFVIVRAVFKNGEIATQHLVIQIDNKKPSIRLISPVPLGHYNGNLIFSGLFSDETNLKDVSITMRKGDKSMYEMPSIFQGMYFDAHVLGASMYDVGLGFSFFDNNVKLQAQFGQMTDDMYVALCNLYGIENGGMRYGGNIIGVKLLANIFDLPFKYYFGPDWEWLGMSFAIGADFSIFTQTQANKAQVLSAIIAQLEFPRITIPQAKVFGTYSFYTEYQLWFIPSDIDDDTVKSVVNQLGFGLRVYLF